MFIEKLSIIHLKVHDLVPIPKIDNFPIHSTTSGYEAAFLIGKTPSFCVLIDMRDWEEEYIAETMIFLDHLRSRYPDRYRYCINVDEGIKPTILNMEEDDLIHDFFEIHDADRHIGKHLSLLHDEYLLRYSRSTMIENFLAQRVQIQRIRDAVDLELMGEYLEAVIDANFIELALGLNEVKEKRKLANLLIDYVNGLKAMIGLAAKLLYQKGVYLQTKETRYLSMIFNALNQIEIVGTYFNQKILMMFSLYVRSLIYHSIHDRENAEGTFLAADQMKQWFQQNDSELDIVNIFDTIGFFYLSLLENEIINMDEAERDFLYALDSLLSIPIEELIWLREPFFALDDLLPEGLHHSIIITSNMMTLFSRSNIPSANQDLPILLGNFVNALMTLVNEFGDSESLERIYFKKGAIYVYPVDNLNFILFTMNKEIRDKVALKEFSAKAVNIFKKYEITSYNYIPNEAISELNHLAKSYFGV